MNESSETRAPITEDQGPQRSRIRGSGAFHFPLSVVALLAVVVGASLTGCLSFLKPARGTARHFVLASLPAGPGPVAGGAAPLAVGVGFVKLPAYLFNNSVAVRVGTNEINYLESALWAERLDQGFQRVLGANLSALLPTDQVRLSAWRPQDVSVEVYVAVEQFDVATSGRAILVAQWRLLAPGGGKLLQAGECRLTRPGPAPEADPAGAVATLSELVADLSRQLTEAIKRTASH